MGGLAAAVVRSSADIYCAELDVWTISDNHLPDPDPEFVGQVEERESLRFGGFGGEFYRRG